MNDSPVMVERVARAIRAVREGGFRFAPPTQGELFEARAAIAAMREPTEEMRVAGNAFVGAPREGGPQGAAVVWTAMIDNALGA